MKAPHMLIAAGALLAGVLYMARRAMAAKPIDTNTTAALNGAANAGALPTMSIQATPALNGPSVPVGGSPYRPGVTNTAATLPYGFDNTTPSGEFINGF